MDQRHTLGDELAGSVTRLCKGYSFEGQWGGFNMRPSRFLDSAMAAKG